MSRSTLSAPRPLRAAMAAAFVATACSLAPAPAGAARVEKIAVPSAKNNVDLTQTRLNKTTKLEANILLPDGYDEQPEKRWPVVYLLAGIGDNANTWLDPKKGDAAKLFAGFPGIVVMPESGRGYFTDWYRGGTRLGSKWERYYFEEVIPMMESKYRIAPGRQNHAIGGPSMAGFGATLFVGQFPSYFGTAFSLSGLLDLQNPGASIVVPLDIGAPFTKLWGKPNGAYAEAHNPVRMVGNNAGSRVYVSTGNGTPSAKFKFDFSAYTSGAVAEMSVRLQSLRYAARARLEGVDVEYSGHTGVHDWPYWRLEIPRLIKWGLFGAPKVTDPTAHTSWTYRTIAQQGNAWSLGYKLQAPPNRIVTFKRSGQKITGIGAGTVTITPGAADTDATGGGTKPECGFKASLPFEVTLAPGC